MANKPYMCGGSDITIPACSDCDELQSRVEALEEEVEQCCAEVRDTLGTHTEQIADIYSEIDYIKLQISTMTGLRTEIVEELPETGEPNVIYLIEGQDETYSMWLYSDNEWVQVGGGEIDLTNYITDTDLQTALADYVTSTDLSTALADKQDAMTISTGLRLDSNTLERVPLIDEIVVTGSDTQPIYYGTYTLVDKDFAPQVISNANVTWAGITSDRSSSIRKRDKQITLKMYFDASLDDTARRICRISLDTLGLSNAPYQYFLGYNDYAGQIAQFEAYVDSGYLAIDCVDVIPHSGSSEGRWHFQFDVEFAPGQMKTSDCDRFYWKRTA